MANNGRQNGRVWSGLFLTGIGAVLLLRQFGIDFPYWFFTWPVFLIGLGLFIGLKHGFKGPSWAIMIFIGAIFLADIVEPDLKLRKFALPIALIGFGLMILLRPKKTEEWRKDWKMRSGRAFGNSDEEYPAKASPIDSDQKSESLIDSVAVFGGVRKVIVSKDFKGGELVSIFGGNEIDLSQADITAPVVIDFVQIMGGSKLIIPAHWEVRSEIVAVFGGIEDKRRSTLANYDPAKVLILRGTSIFGGIDIRNY